MASPQPLFVRTVAALFFALGVVAGALRAADAPAGHWEGAIELPEQKLAFDVDLRRDGAVWAGDITIPAQGAQDLPLQDIAFDAGTVRFAITGVPGNPSFSGKLEGNEIAGDFTQGGATFPFRMSSGAPLAERARAALEGFDPIVEQALADFGVPGLALAVVAGDEVVLERGYGKRDLEAGRPVTPATLFAIGSTTKAFTAFVLATLVEDGKLEWDQPVLAYLPDFRLHDDHATRRLKVRDLLIHSSGLPRHDLVWYNSSASREELFERLRHLEPTRDLGEEFQYQNLMYLTAGYLAERVTGKSWETLVRERILEPLGMTRTNFAVADSQRDADHALPYSLEDRTARRIPFRDITTIGPAGSINSSVSEMTRWMRLHLGDGEIDGTRLLPAAAVREMHTPHNAISQYPQDQDVLTLGYGMGWTIQAHRGHYLVQHGGGIDGFISWVALLPFDDIGVVAYTNASGFNPLPVAVARMAIDRVLGLEPIDHVAKAREQLAQAEKSQAEAERNENVRRREGTSPSRELDAYAGEYEHPGYGVVRVTRDGDALRLEYNEIPVRLEHWHYDTWNGVVAEGADPTFENAKVQFRLDVDGEVAQLVAPFEPALSPIVFERRPDARLSEPEYLARFVGTYELTGQRGEVELRGDRLRLALPGQPVYTLEPKRENEFALPDVEGFTVEFLLDAGGAVTGARFHQPNGTFEAKRVDE
jgi:CubicO group peptidase (beta-lactamase class C family)